MAIEHISPAAEKGSSSTGNRREEGNLVPIRKGERPDIVPVCPLSVQHQYDMRPEYPGLIKDRSGLVSGTFPEDGKNRFHLRPIREIDRELAPQDLPEPGKSLHPDPHILTPLPQREAGGRDLLNI